MPAMRRPYARQRHSYRAQIAAQAFQIEQSSAGAKRGIRLLQAQNIRINFSNHRRRPRQIAAAVVPTPL